MKTRMLLAAAMSILMVGCNSNEEAIAEAARRIELLEQQMMRLEAEKDQVQAEKDQIQEQLERLIPDQNHIVIDKHIHPEVLHVLYNHFDAIAEHDEEKYHGTILHPENSNSTWTWRLANEAGLSYRLRQLTHWSDGGDRVLFTCVFELSDGKTMSPQFMFAETESGWKIYDID